VVDKLARKSRTFKVSEKLEHHLTGVVDCPANRCP
jgi:hypothetical protein